MMKNEEFEMVLRKDGMSGVMRKRIIRLMGEFATPEGFFTAQKADVMKAYSKLTPGGDHGLGNAFWLALNRATELYREHTSGVKQTSDVVEPAPEPAVRTEELRMLSVQELKTVVEFMELCDVEAINIIEITGFLNAVRMRQKKPETEKMEGASKEDFALKP